MEKIIGFKQWPWIDDGDVIRLSNGEEAVVLNNEALKDNQFKIEVKKSNGTTSEFIVDQKASIPVVFNSTI